MPPPPPDYAHVAPLKHATRDEELRYWLMVHMWNWAWEAGQIRPAMFKEEDVPPELRWLENYEYADIRLVLDGRRSPYTLHTRRHMLNSTLEELQRAALLRGRRSATGIADL